MAKRGIACVLVVSTLLSGCLSNPHLHGGKLVAEYQPDDGPNQSHTPYQATYVLYHWQDPPSGAPPHTWVPEKQMEELYVRGLTRREPIGFEKDAEGKLFAVAGKERIPLVEGRYCWHISTETEYRGCVRVLHDMGEATLDVICFPFELAAGIIFVPIFVGILGVFGFCALGAACAS